MQNLLTEPLEYALRPSVSVIPQNADVYEFFKSSTRLSVFVRAEKEIINKLLMVSGVKHSLNSHSFDKEKYSNFINFLHEKSIVEKIDIRDRIDSSNWSRVLNFLGDYFPSNEIFGAFSNLQNARILIMGCGAIGSWTAVQLAHSGVRNFILIDNDNVEISNLNRSLFSAGDIGKKKTKCMKEKMQSINDEITVEEFSQFIEDKHELEKIYTISRPDIIINASDWPSVDETSLIMDSVCQKHSIPYIIAGGYNIHLSLIGMTVLPGKSACVKCSKIVLDEHNEEKFEEVKKLVRPTRNLGNLSPLASLSSSITSMEALRLAVQSNRLLPAMLNRRGEFNFFSGELNYFDIPPQKKCSCLAAKR